MLGLVARFFPDGVDAISDERCRRQGPADGMLDGQKALHDVHDSSPTRPHKSRNSVYRGGNAKIDEQRIWFLGERETPLPPDGRSYPHPGEHQTKLLGRSSGLPSSFSGAFPCENVAQWHFARVVRLTAAGGCTGMSARQSHRIPVSPTPRSWSKEPKTLGLYAKIGRLPILKRQTSRETNPSAARTGRANRTGQSGGNHRPAVIHPAVKPFTDVINRFIARLIRKEPGSGR